MDGMLLSQNFKVGDGSTRVWEFAFAGYAPDNVQGAAYLRREDVFVDLINYAQETTTRSPVSFEWVGDSTNTIRISPPIAAGQEFVIYRDSGAELLRVDFNDFSSITESDLDTSYRHPVYLAMETRDSLGSLQTNLSNLASDVYYKIDRVDQDSKERDDQEKNARIAADRYLQNQISGEAPIPASERPVIQWHEQVIRLSVDVPSNVNAFSAGPFIKLADDVVVTVGDNSFYTVMSGSIVQ